MPPIFWTQKQDIGPSARTGHGMAYDAARQRIVVFGGDPGGSPLADTWHWDGNLWTQVADTGPSARRHLAMADNAAAQRIVLFGGAKGGSVFGDTWAFDGTEWTQVADTGPQARAGHAVAYDSTQGLLVLFGGQESGAPLGDTWAWGGQGWTQIQDVGPTPRHGHAMAFDPARGQVILFGGTAGNGTGLNDTWAWDGSTWTQVADTGPESRVRPALVGAGSVLLFGGVNSIDPALPAADRTVYGDSWRWDANGWTKVQDIGPAPRWGHGMAFRSDAGRIVLFGGGSAFAAAESASLAPGLRNDTWEVPDAAANPGGAGILDGVEVDIDVTTFVLQVGVTPNSIPAYGGALTVTVFANPQPPGGMLLGIGIYHNTLGSLEPVAGFLIPSVFFNGAESTTSFTIVRDPTFLAPGEYAVGVSLGGGPMQAASFTLT
jgi:hypothetical protein